MYRDRLKEVYISAMEIFTSVGAFLIPGIVLAALYKENPSLQNYIIYASVTPPFYALFDSIVRLASGKGISERIYRLLKR